MERSFPRFLGAAQLREYACYPGLACAKQSRRSAKIPYLLVWKDKRHNGEIKEAVRLARCVGALDGYIELKRTDGSTTVLRIVWRMLPRNGGRALFLLCPHCDTPRRFVYGWEWDSFSGWSNRVRRTIGVADPVIGCATLPKAATYGLVECSALSESVTPRVVVSLRVHVHS